MNQELELDQSFISELKKGNKDSFKKIFNLHFHAISSFGNKYISDPAVVQDIVQDVFMSFWEKRTDFEHLYSIKSFLYTSVRNKCLNVLKHEEVKRKNENAIVYDLESEQNYSNHIIEEETFSKLYEEIKALPQSSREIMLLALNGLKNPEIAEELGISVNTVKTQKKIAYSKLKNRLTVVQSLILICL